MSTFKTYFTITCMSFTFLILIYALLSELGLFSPMTMNEILLYFLMTLCGSVLIALTDRLPISNGPVNSLVRILDVAVSVFGIGIAFDLFPLEWSYILPIIGMILIIYVGVSAVVMIKGKADASEINKQLSRRMQQPNKAGGEKHE
ncbi:DUF3021 family protein [Paenibacillus nanensis]|uniref:DUF3021 family protein n=1 Tax=Paenibacillus nanensis TaxID=393251 RepID=A0A3A1UMV9_9BACL|nr:DUF3021 family protein [Paenibacillus nanensis]RIX48720.1 DUF3021 family protein [Paenibacillus nanensis]